MNALIPDFEREDWLKQVLENYFAQVIERNEAFECVHQPPETEKITINSGTIPSVVPEANVQQPSIIEQS